MMYKIFFILFFVVACGDSDPIEDETMMEEEILDISDQARIVSAEVSGDSGDYRFNIGISSPDTGCDQYADWWEVINPAGDLLYRRILGHSHVNEQPFSRSGGPIDINPSDRVIIRAHMNNTGYGRQAFAGTVQDGFEEEILSDDFYLELGSVDPQPGDCAF